LTREIFDFYAFIFNSLLKAVTSKEEFNLKAVQEEDVTCFDKIGFESQETLRKAFEWWARNVACRFPITVLLFSLIWTGALIAGFKDIEFTTGFCLFFVLISVFFGSFFVYFWSTFWFTFCLFFLYIFCLSFIYFLFIFSLVFDYFV